MNHEKFISYGRQNIDEDDIASVAEVLKSDFITQGPKVAEFEKAIADYVGAKYCVVVSNGTAALHLAVNALKPDCEKNEGITSTNSFVASANCFLYNNLKPILTDIDKHSYNMCLEDLNKKITDKTKVIIPVHFAGRSVNMKEISHLSKAKNISVIEDACHAFGSKHQCGSMVGSCKYSDMTVFSFHPVKNITTGEGGAITTNDESLYKALKSLRSHGMEKNGDTSDIGPWFYQIKNLGFNYRLPDILAALGLSQLKKVESIKSKRNKIIQKYTNAFKGIDWIKAPQKDLSDSLFHLYVIQIDFEKIGKSKKEVMNLLLSQGIGTQVHYIPIHSHEFYKNNYHYESSDYPNAEEYYLKALSIPLFPNMSEDETARVIDTILALPKAD